jgi:hypothetical protein
MKTLREYIDQLDEISRRDFLKGAGATAGLAAVGAPKAQTSESEIVEQMLKCYYITSKLYPQNAQNLLVMIQTYIKKNPGKKDFVNQTYRKVKDQLDTLEKNDFLKYSNEVGYLVKNMGTIMDKFQDLYVFGQAPAPTSQQLASVRTAMANEESLEETSEDPIAKIDALFKDKK